MDKVYEKYSIIENPEILEGYAGQNSLSEDVLSKLSKSLGLSYDMYVNLSNVDKVAAGKLVISVCRKNEISEVYLLIDQDTSTVLGISLDPTREPILNSEFMKRSLSLLETCDAIEVADKYLVEDDLDSSILIKKKDSIVVEQGTRRYSYETGILLYNNELDCAMCRLVIFLNGQPYYLPSSFYSSSTNRYRKSTGNTAEALEVLILKIIDELREDYLKYKLGDFYLRHSVNEQVVITYEEYNRILRTMMQIPTVLDDRGVLQDLTDRLSEFEKKYTHLEDQKSSYIWRCTAMGPMTVGDLIPVISETLNGLYAPLPEYYDIRDLIGAYLGTRLIATEIAQEDTK